DPREPRGKGERLDPTEDVLDCEEELQQEPAVQIHGARDVAQQHQLRLLALAGAEAQLDEIRAREIRAQRPPQVHAAAPAHRAPPPADPPREAARDLDREPQHLVELIGRERREVLTHEALLVGHRGHAERLARIVAAIIVAPGVEGERLALLTRPRYRKRFLRAEAGRDQTGNLRLAGVSESPERVEAAVEDRFFFGPGVEDRDEPEIQLDAIGDVEMMKGRV